MNARIGSLFSGYGGLDMGIESVLDAETVWFSEIEPAPSKILAHHWPDKPNHGDITKIDWAAVEPIEILCGGFPCQDVSLAGARKGLKDGTRSGLWSEFATAIEALRPQLVVIENVRGLLSAAAGETEEWTDDEIDQIAAARRQAFGQGDRDMESRTDGLGESARPDGPVLNAFGSVLGDLARLGYDTDWCGVRAADAGAPHGRFRVFIVAYRGGFGGRESNDPARFSPEGADGASVAHEHSPRPSDTQWGEYEPAIRRWEALTRPAPSPTLPDGKNGSHRLSAVFVEWMMGLPLGHVTNPAIGLTRNEELKALGNGVVPRQVALALRHLLARTAPAA